MLKVPNMLRLFESREKNPNSVKATKEASRQSTAEDQAKQEGISADHLGQCESSGS
jgi:hypothetical protein